MAELVELTKEKRLGELEQMKRIKLLDDFEINKIKKQREYYEYKLVARQKKLEDILKYIAYEDTILVFLQERRKSRGIYAKKSIELRIITKIFMLFEKAVTRYPNQIEIWDKYIKFCKATDNKPKVTALFGKYISFHGDKSVTWLKAGMWEWIENKNYVKSISYLTRGLQRHPKSFQLFMALINVELSFTETSKCNPSEERDPDPEVNEALSLKKAQIFYDKLKEENLATESNSTQLIGLVKGFEFAKPLLKQIVEDLKTTVSGSSKNIQDQPELSEDEVDNKNEELL